MSTSTLEVFHSGRAIVRLGYWFPPYVRALRYSSSGYYFIAKICIALYCNLHFIVVYFILLYFIVVSCNSVYYIALYCIEFKY